MCTLNGLSFFLPICNITSKYPQNEQFSLLTNSNNRENKEMIFTLWNAGRFIYES